jgi:hypothetical protein
MTQIYHFTSTRYAYDVQMIDGNVSFVPMVNNEYCTKKTKTGHEAVRFKTARGAITFLLKKGAIVDDRAIRIWANNQVGHVMRVSGRYMRISGFEINEVGDSARFAFEHEIVTKCIPYLP